MIVTKEFDSPEEVRKALIRYGKNPDEWFMMPQYVLDTDIYERLPQYMPIKIEFRK
jgi:hypothetical protein